MKVHIYSTTQWYSYTGSFGGTFWILMINVMLYNFIICKSFNSLLYLSSIIVIPITISFVIKNNVSNYKSISANFQIVAINTKFSGSLKYKETESSLLKQQIKLSYLCIDTSENTLIVWPESSITSKIKTTKIKESYAYKILNARLIKNNSSLISGTILSNNNHTYTGSVFFKKDSTSFRVKEKLVPFNEYYPIPNSPKWMKNILYTGVFEFSTYQNNKAFISKDINIGSLICFESFFGNFVRKLIDSNNIEIIVIGLNEGWYKKKGYKLAEAHAVSRSIENRKPIIKSSNEGFTTYINYYGKIVKTIKNEGCINIIPSFIKKTTFYQKNGDWLPILSIVFLIISLSVTFIKNFLIKDY